MVMLLTALTLTVSAATQPTQSTLTPAEHEQFKAYVLEGEQQFSAGEYGAAIWNFRAADALRVTPEMAFNLAKAHEKIGDHPMAAYYYRLYLKRAPDASDALDVAGILGDILSKMEADGRGLVELEASAPGAILIDGERWPQAPVSVFLPPGDFDVTLLGANGKPALKTKVSVITGRAVALSLEPLPPPLLNADGEEAAVASASSSDFGGHSSLSGRQALHVTSMVLVGASVAALGVGTAFGAMSSSDAGRLTNKAALSVSDAQALARSAGQKGATANVLWAAGGIGAAAGGAMFAFTLPEPGMPKTDVEAGSGGGAR